MTSFRVTLDDAHFSRLALSWERGRHAGTWRRGLRAAGEALGAVAVMYLIFRRGAGMGFTAAALFGGWWVANRLRRRKAAMSPEWREAAGEEAEYAFDSHGLRMRSGRLDLRLPWSSLDRAVLFRAGVLLIFGPRHVHWLPVSGEEAGALFQILRFRRARVVVVR